MKISPINRNSRVIQRAIKKLNRLVLAFFKKEAKQISARVATAYEKVMKDVDPRVKKILDEIDVSGFAVLFGDVGDILAEITKDGVIKALIQIGMKQEDITEQMSDLALEFAQTRAAELVGMKWVDGELIENPNPAWAISESTREFLRADVAGAVEEGWSTQRLAAAVQDNYAFSSSRSEMIARTEIAFAHVEGNMIAYRESGLVSGKYWLLGSEHDDDDECDANAAAGTIPLDEDFPSGDMAPPSHPRCVCDVIPVLASQEGE